MAIFRRFTQFPGLDVLGQIESINIVDLPPPGVFLGIEEGVVCLVGEWPKGPYNTPTEVSGDDTIRSTFGGFSISVADPLSFATNRFSNGNAFCWVKGKVFSDLILVRADMRLVNGVDLTLTGTPSPLPQNITLPAGTRVRDPGAPTKEFALASDVVIASGTDLTVNASSAFVEGVASTTRTVTGVPVYSVQGVTSGAAGSVTQIDSGDLFRAGFGAGATFPSLAWAVTNSAGVLTVLTSNQIDTAYTNAINSTVPNANPQDKINVIASARQSTAIRAALNANAASSSASGTGRMALIRPPIGTSPATAEGSGDPGVGANRSDRVVYCYPHFQQQIPEIPVIDPTQTGLVFLGADSLMAMTLSNLPPEENPGQDTGLLTMVLGLEPGLTGAGATAFALSDYINFKAGGIAALTRDSHSGDWLFQSGVTSVLASTSAALTPIKRRRMTDFIEDSFARIAVKYDKKLGSNRNKVALLGEITDFLELLLSPQNDAQQRISAYQVDSLSGNTQKLAAAGIYIIIVEVTLLPSMDSIVFQVQSGEGVVIVTNPGT